MAQIHTSNQNTMTYFSSVKADILLLGHRENKQRKPIYAWYSAMNIHKPRNQERWGSPWDITPC